MRVLFLDDVRQVPRDLLLSEVTVARSAAEAQQIVLDQPTFDLWSLDHDLGMEVKDHLDQIVSASEKNAHTGYVFLKWV